MDGVRFFSIAALFIAGIPYLMANSAGPYECVTVLNVETCPCEVDECIDLRVGVMDDGKGRHITGSWSTPYSFSDADTMTKATFYQKSSSGKYQIRGNGSWTEPCKRMHEVAQDVLDKLADASGFEPHCPIPKGEYKLENYSPCIKLEKFPVCTYGEFKYIVEVFKLLSGNYKKVGCFMVETRVDQKHIDAPL